MSSSLTKEIFKKMQVELQNYLQKKGSFKDYSQSMKEISLWLEKEAKR